jgi:hypothetical protein
MKKCLELPGGVAHHKALVEAVNNMSGARTTKEMYKCIEIARICLNIMYYDIRRIELVCQGEK